MATRIVANLTSESIPPTPSTASDDNDAVNTEEARVYFGPIHSPEKKLALDPANQRRTPIHRSSRVSSIPRQPASSISTPNLTLNAVDLDGCTTSSIQDESMISGDAYLEEPSSALATKVLHAWDNPSPPPGPPTHPSLSKFHVPIDSGLASAKAADTPPLEPVHPDPHTSDTPTVLNTQVDGSVYPGSHDSEVAYEPNPEPDLITFDSFSTDGTPRACTPSTITEPFPSSDSPVTVDQLLTISPTRIKSPSPSGAVVVPEVREQQHTKPDFCTRENTGILTPDEEQAAKHFLTTPPRQPAINLIPAIEVDGDHATALRRSSRPRRSVSPLVTPLTAQLPRPTTSTAREALLPISPGEPLPLSPRSGPARRKSMKGKERMSPLPSTRAGEVDDNAMRSDHMTSVDKSTAMLLTGSSRPPVRRDSTGETYDVRLGSLSPTSANVLSQLLPGGSDSKVATPHVDENPFVEQQGVFTDKSQSSDSPPPPPAQVVITHEPPRTPARRIPISQAFKQGVLPSHTAHHFLSPHKSDLNSIASAALASSAFRRIPLNDPSRSPAKRIPISEAMSSTHSPMKTKASVTTCFSFAAIPQSLSSRSKSEEPQMSLVPKKNRSASAEPTMSTIPAKKGGLSQRIPSSAIDTPVKSSTSLPFPVIRQTTTIPEGDETDVQSHDQSTSSNVCTPMKGPSLRQPPGRVESRIPRIGAKPYARPTLKPPKSGIENGDKISIASDSQNAVDRVAPNTPKTQPPRVARRAIGKPPSTSIDTVVAGPGPASQRQHAARTLTHAPPSSTTLKRKRDEESKSSTVDSRPVVLVRKVTFTGSKPTTSKFFNGSVGAPDKSPAKGKNLSAPESRSATTGPGQGKIRMRKVVNVERPSAKPSPPPVSQDGGATAKTFLEQLIPSETTSELPVTLDEQPVESDAVAVAPSPPPVLSVTPSPEAELPTAIVDLSPSFNVRRTSRTRKLPQDKPDVFGAVRPANTKSSSRKRAHPPDSGAFAGMTALALKSLTASNTIRNQQQVVELHTEVVRVESKRPDSPTTKVRTILERQREDRIKQRQVRAERRAQRAGGASENGEADADAGSSDAEDGVMRDADASGVSAKHRRGPGEDEDYETPPRLERPLKRGRFEEGVEEGAEEQATINERRVKWDHGLSTTVYLDDSPPKPSRPIREEVIMKKGCLTPAAKTLRLDTMGNVLNASNPLADLVHDNIIVKKFVYLDDPELDPPPEPVNRSTRSRSKKAKS